MSDQTVFMYLDENGDPWTGGHSGSGSFLAGVDSPPQAQPWPKWDDDINKAVSIWDEQYLVNIARRLHANSGIAKAFVEDPAVYATGQAWRATYIGKDASWGEVANDWLKEMWMPSAELKGGDWITSLYQILVNLGHSGDLGVRLVEVNGWPKIQLIPQHAIGVRSGMDDFLIEDPESEFDGMRCRRGVVFDEYGCEVGYHLLGDTPDDDEWVPATQLIFIKDATWIDQVRGWPALYASLKELRVSMSTQDFEELALAIAGSEALLIHNETGTDPEFRRGINASTDDETVPVTTSAQAAVEVKRLDKGRITYYRAGSNSKVEQLKHERPGPQWMSFQDMLKQIASAGVGFPLALIQPGENLPGPAVRMIQNRGRAYIADRQAILFGVAKRIITFVLAVAMKNGLLPFSTDWMRWSFSLPPVLTIDPGRDLKMQIEEFKLGALNMSEWLAERGALTTYEHYRQRARDIVDRKRAVLDELSAAEERYGVKFVIDDREMLMLTANDMADDEKTNEDETNKTDEIQ